MLLIYFAKINNVSYAHRIFKTFVYIGIGSVGNCFNVFVIKVNEFVLICMFQTVASRFIVYSSAMALSSDKVAELKQIIHNYLSQVFARMKFLGISKIRATYILTFLMNNQIFHLHYFQKHNLGDISHTHSLSQ